MDYEDKTEHICGTTFRFYVIAFSETINFIKRNLVLKYR